MTSRRPVALAPYQQGYLDLSLLSPVKAYVKWSARFQAVDPFVIASVYS